MKRFFLMFMAVLMAVSCMIVPCFAVETPPYLTHEEGYSYYYWATGTTSVPFNCLKYKDGTVTVSGDEGADGKTYYTPNGEGFFEQYAYYGDEWHLSSGGTTTDVLSWSYRSSVYWTSEDIYDHTTGELVYENFQVPLWEEVEQMTQGEMVNLQQTTVGVMRILVLCGVGCLALLMALPLLSKKFKIFLH